MVVTSEFDVIFQEITRLSFKVCIKDSQGMSKSHDPVAVDYAIVGGILMFPLHLMQGAVIEKKISLDMESQNRLKKRCIY